eukprot:scpid43193/ scgid7881/ 
MNNSSREAEEVEDSDNSSSIGRAAAVVATGQSSFVKTPRHVSSMHSGDTTSRRNHHCPNISQLLRLTGSTAAAEVARAAATAAGGRVMYSHEGMEGEREGDAKRTRLYNSKQTRLQQPCRPSVGDEHTYTSNNLLLPRYLSTCRDYSDM